MTSVFLLFGMRLPISLSVPGSHMYTISHAVLGQGGRFATATTRAGALLRNHMNNQIANARPGPDAVSVDIVDYVLSYSIDSKLALETACFCLIETLGCGLEALTYPVCTKLMVPMVPGTVVPNGAKLPGTEFQLDPVHAAFNIGVLG